MALILNYLILENPDFTVEDKINPILEGFLEKSPPFYFLWAKDDLEKNKSNKKDRNKNHAGKKRLHRKKKRN